MKKITAAYFILFALLFLLPLGLLLAGVGRTSEDFEQRELTQMPSLAEGLSEFPEAFEAYWADRLPFRAPMIRLNNRVNYAMLSGTDSLNLIQGREGWLFYNPAGSDGDPMGDYYNAPPLDEDFLERTRQAMTEARDALAAQGCDFALMIAPNKATIYGDEFFPAYYPRRNGVTRGEQVMTWLAEETDLKLLMPLELLRTAPDPRVPDTYFKYDTHWNSAYAYEASRMLVQLFGAEMPTLAELELEQTESDYQDLADMLSMSGSLDPEWDYIPLDYSNREVIIDDSEDGIIRTHCPGADPRKLLMIRDSFCFAMMDPISTQFAECVFVTHPDYEPELIQQEQPDILVYESAERFVHSLPRFTVE